MRELSLFAGAGGGLLGTRLLGWRHVGYVEIDNYCQRVIARRIADGLLDCAPIFTDVRQFVESGAADQYRGIADVVAGGFPCQPFSLAGRRRGAADERNLWPATMACIRAVRPRFCLLENVPGLITSGYFGTVLGDLAESGYDCRWRILSAAELGAPHLRKRLWLAAHAHSAQRRTDGTQRHAAGRSPEPAWTGDAGTAGDLDVADSPISRDGGLEQGRQRGERQRQSGDSRRALECADTERHGLEGEQQAGTEAWAADRSGDGRNSGWWEAEPDVGRVADGVAARVERLRALGNGQVPLVAAAAWRLLTADWETQGEDE